MLRRFNLRIASGLLLLLGALAPTASAQFSISGTARDPGLAAVASVELRLYDGTGVAIGIPLTLTDGSGFYSLGPLPSGNYIVEFRPPVATHLLPVQLPASVAGSSITRDASLALGNILSGFVRDSGGTPIANIDLQVTDRTTNLPVLTPGDDTDVNGFYAVVIPSSEFDLEWRAVAAGSLPWIPVTIRQDVLSDTSIDVTMFLGNVVAGTITNSLGVPVANVNLDFVDALTGAKADTPGDNTAVDGSYSALVPSGTYDLRLKPKNADRLLALELPDFVVAGDSGGNDFVLQPGVLISGQVTQAGAGGVEAVEVNVEDPATGTKPYVPFNSTDLDGFYQIVVAAQPRNFVFEPNLLTGLAPKRVGPLAFATDGTLDVTLDPGVALTGTIHDQLAQPIAGVDIDVNDSVSGLSLPLVGDGSDVNGNFTVLIPPGSYVIDIEPPSILGYVAQQFGPSTVSGPTSLDVTLVPGATISGTVQDPMGSALAGVNVDALRAFDGVEIFTPGDRSDALGFYRIVVPPDDYDLVFRPLPNPALLDSLLLEGEAVFVDRTLDVTIPPASPTSTPPPSPGFPGTALAPPSPNPFNPSTLLTFSIGLPGEVSLHVYAQDGRLVRTIARRHFIAGSHQLRWDGRDDQGRLVASGSYFLRLLANGQRRSQKLVLLK